MLIVEELLKLQMEYVEKWHENTFPIPKDTDINSLIGIQHHYNFELWHQEDLARDTDATDHQIANVKRNIDKLNQKRNDQIEIIDEKLLVFLNSKKISLKPNSQMNSETPGSIIDRLSINALKIYHMNEQTHREDIDENHLKKCMSKLAILREQRQDLGYCLKKLWEDILDGVRYYKIYHQMKMYNDETLNPILYKSKVKA